MQIVATTPKFLARSNIPEEELAKETEIIKEQTISSQTKKLDDQQLEKIINAKMNKWYEDVVLLEQNFVITDYEDDAKPAKIQDLLMIKGKDYGTELKINDFKLFH